MVSLQAKTARAWSVGMVVVCAVTAAMLCTVSGCGEDAQKSPSDGTGTVVAEQKLSDIYTGVHVRQSNSLDVLEMVRLRPQELLTQSDSVVSSLGQDKDGFKAWFTMVAFDEHKMTATRKYFFIVNETAVKILFASQQGMAFECEIVPAAEILQKPYDNENARTTTILKLIQSGFRSDLGELGDDLDTAPDSRRLSVCGIMVNQILNDILTQIGGSPVLAAKLGDVKGLEFTHMNFNNGVAKMFVIDGKVKLQVDLGAPISWRF